MLTLAGIAALVCASFAYLSLHLERLLTLDALRDLTSFFVSFFPPDVSRSFIAKTTTAGIETLAVSAVGTLLAVLCGLLLALPASGRYGAGLRMSARFMLNLLRSIPELVWAALMVLAAGLGPFAGTLALAAHTSGVLGRLFAEALENAPRAPADALAEAGAAPALAFLYGTLPGVLPQLLAYILYRWEMNIRMAAILGFVGAGGLGQMLYFELSLLHQAQACTVIIAMLLLAAFVDTLSATLRRRLAIA
ncbi:MAG TPA: phosphonate ABC transporter, permease protein PhnE [Casimicrobiaceae bacterium]